MDSPNFSNQQQERISHRLKELVSPGSAAFWRDACRLMEMEPLLESTTHLVGHLLREIESSLRDVLMRISKQSEPLEPSKQGAKKKNLSGDEIHKAEIEAVLKVLEIPETSPVAQTWLSLPGRDNEYGLAKRAHRKALERPRPIDGEFREFWDKMQAVLDGVLDRFEAKYAKVFCLLDELAAKPEPTDLDLKALCNSIPNSFVTRRYLFERLNSPGWLNKLQEEGFFKNPPEPEVDAETGRILVWQWPQSRYLAAMAYLEPEKVLNIALEILETGTENAFVHEDLAEAARSMRPELAARWVEKETEWLKEQDYLYFSFPEKLGKLIAYLAQREQVNAALGLARELLAVLPNSQNDDLLVKSRTRCDDYYYQQILTEYVSKLVAPAGEATLDLLCNLLNDAISFRQFPHEEVVSDDRSDHWYPTFEENRQYLLYEARVFLTTAIWKTTQQMARNDPARVPCLAEKLESYHWRIFHRIALHLLRCFPNEVADLIAERLADRHRLNEPILCYEYVVLLKERFADLDSKLQEKIFGWIAEGPDDTFRVREEKITAYIKHWQRDWLSILSDSLPVKWQQQYEQLVEELGSAESLKPSGGIKLQQGPTSPKSAEELAAMSMAERLAFLEEWQPTGDPFAPSPSGLRGELSKVIAQKPKDFVSVIEQFKQLEPEDRRCLLEGLNHALSTHGQRQAFSWLEPLEFCSWMLEQQPEITEGEASLNALDLEWNQICDAVVSLLERGLEQIGENEIPIELRSQVWTILEQLTEDPRLIPGFKTHYRYSNARPVEAYGSTVRGKAMHRVLDYALWVLRQINREENQEEQTARGFDEMPEVRELLERHLNPEYDSSLTIRSIYGERLASLMNLDLNWTSQNLKRIFPRDEALQELRDAAWEGYLTSGYSDAELFATLFATLREEYSHAIKRIGTATPEWQNRSRADEALAVHLLDLYWRGELELGESDQLLERFFANASAHNREEFMKQIAWWLRYRNFEVGTDLLRLQRLWEWRVSDVESTQATNSQASDLKFFSWWFISRKFDDTWAIVQLINTLRLAKALHYDPDLLRHLVALAPSMPLATVECLGLMAEANGTPGDKLFAFYHQEDYCPILSAVLQSEDKQACKAAKELINRLLVRGIDFRDLLSDGEV